MTGPDWWNERRYGLRLHASVSTVPSFSPIGESADWYWAHLGSDALPGTAPHPSPMAETLAYHRDRWSHVDRFDDFIPFLSYHRFDADEHVELALEAGMNYLVQDVKHHDGFCWWDAPGTTRSSVQAGPRRDVTAEIAAASRRNGLVFGTAYSLLDWSDRRDPTEQILDLVERHGTEILWGWGAVPDTSPANVAEILERALDLADAQGLQLAINDGWGSSHATFQTVRHRAPAAIIRTPWELCRPLGSSSCHNRAETAEQLLSTGALLDVLTEVIAKGGNLLIEVGPSVDGSIAEIHKQPLLDVGEWVYRHADVIHGSRPFDLWGDAQIRYVQVPGSSTGNGTDDVVAIDLAAGAEVVLAGLTPESYDITSIEADDGGSLHWEQHRGGVRISRIDRSPTGLAGAYRIRLHPAAEAIRLFEEREPTPIAVQPMLDAASPGAIVQLPEGTYEGPIVVPPRVTLRGVGWDRTVVVDRSSGSASPTVTLGMGARIENIDISADAAVTAVTVAAGGFVIGCRTSGQVVIDGDDVSVLSVIGTGVVGSSERTTIERCSFRGDLTNVGIDLSSGSGHRIHRNEIIEHLAAIRLTDVSASSVSENRVESRWWAVHVVRCDHIEVVDNTIQHTMRAVDVEGGNGSVVTGNWVADGDSGAVIGFGASDTSVIDNHIERCRTGIIVWDAPTSIIGPNTFVDLHEEDPVVHGPDSDSD
ncbi:MAG: alpha-L-fucosidase [Ilumatobacteraceae bacterium]